MGQRLRHPLHLREAIEFWSIVGAGLWDWVRPSRREWPR